jgi:hypothetical protein
MSPPLSKSKGPFVTCHRTFSDQSFRDAPAGGYFFATYICIGPRELVGFQFSVQLNGSAPESDGVVD